MDFCELSTTTFIFAQLKNDITIIFGLQLFLCG